MAAIVRVKRSRNDNPANTIVVSCKRAKLDKELENTGDVKGIFKFAATVDEKAGTVSSCVKEAIKKEKLHKELKHQSSIAGVLQKARGQQKQQIVSSRFKLVAEKRAVDISDLDSAQGKDGDKENGGKDSEARSDSASEKSDCRFRLLDVDYDNTSDMTLAPPPDPQSSEEVVMCNNVPMTREKVQPPEKAVAADYVYDIYYLNQTDFDFRALENILTIEATREELVYNDYSYCEPYISGLNMYEFYQYNPNFGWDEDEEVYDDEDNPEDENNWRNDYPDEDPQYCETWDQDYEYDELGGRDFSYDDWGTSQITQMFGDRLKFTQGDESDADSSSTSSTEDHAYFGEAMHPSELTSALEFYDQYKDRLTSQADNPTD